MKFERPPSYAGLPRNLVMSELSNHLRKCGEQGPDSTGRQQAAFWPESKRSQKQQQPHVSSSHRYVAGSKQC